MSRSGFLAPAVAQVEAIRWNSLGESTIPGGSAHDPGIFRLGQQHDIGKALFDSPDDPEVPTLPA
ncbi:MAG TPA: hypothetical protein VLI39_07045 [Sedimentisphaerales bacterium]|nr:hypothetical protein [Sedimentisphaerales bacterium]